MSPKTDALVDCKPGYGLQIASFTAGTTYDNVQHTGNEIDRLGYDTLQVCLNATTTIAANKALKWSCVIHDCATSGGSFALYTTAVADATTAISGITTADLDSVFANVDLSGAKRYVKALVSLDLTATGTDTCLPYIHYNLGGATNIPVS